MIELVRDSLTHALMITGFVFVMMLVIEYLNVLTQGVWQNELARQSLAAVPAGCCSRRNSRLHGSLCGGRSLFTPGRLIGSGGYGNDRHQW